MALGSQERTQEPPAFPAEGYGARLSRRDVVVIAMCALGTWFLHPRVGEPAFLMPLVLGHFFLFCNVFRVGTRRELFWTAAFLGNAFYGLYQVDLSLWRLFLWQTPVTGWVIGSAIRDPHYHGILSRPPASPAPPDCGDSRTGI